MSLLAGSSGHWISLYDALSLLTSDPKTALTFLRELSSGMPSASFSGVLTLQLHLRVLVPNLPISIPEAVHSGVVVLREDGIPQAQVHRQIAQVHRASIAVAEGVEANEHQKH